MVEGVGDGGGGVGGTGVHNSWATLERSDLVIASIKMILIRSHVIYTELHE